LLLTGDDGPIVVGLGASATDYPNANGKTPPSHDLSNDVFLGSAVDFETRLQSNTEATADDSSSSLNDADGLLDLAQLSTLLDGEDLTVDVRATNLGSVDATLYGWIDFDGNRVFDLAERVLANGSGRHHREVYPLSFSVPASVTAGTTYARFRISTDPAAEAPMGHARRW
jgi:hypothetical protein